MTVASEFQPWWHSTGPTVNIQGTGLRGGTWKNIFAVATPKATQRYTYSQSTGHTNSKEQHWDVSIEKEISSEFMGIGSKLKTSKSYGRINKETWTSEETKTMEIVVNPGPSVVVW